MRKKRVLILGGGISGLSAAHFLSKIEYHITLLEKEKRLGGWIATEKEGDFLFEKGPHTIRLEADTCLELIKDLGLEKEVIYADPLVAKRYLWSEGLLRQLPSHPFSFLFSPLMKGVIPALFHEYKTPPVSQEDESVYAFITRRFGSKIADNLIEPWLLGIFAGDIKSLSANICLPLWKKFEQEYGSVVKGFFKREKKPKPLLFSFKEGIETLIHRMQAKISGELILDERVEEISIYSDKVSVKGTTKVWEADELISSLPPFEMKRLFASLDSEISSLFGKIESSTIVSAHLGFNKKIHLPKGFGYLVPSKEKESISGVLFDSQIFPEQNFGRDLTRLTVMMGGVMQKEVETLTENECLQRAMMSIEKHLHTKETPSVIKINKANSALPQFKIGHEKIINQLEQALNVRFPQIKIIGNYFRGASLSECIRRAKSASDYF